MERHGIDYERARMCHDERVARALQACEMRVAAPRRDGPRPGVTLAQRLGARRSPVAPVAP